MRHLPSLLVAASMAFTFAPSAGAEVRVLTSIKPLQLIAAAVQDGVGTPEVLLPPGASPHHFTLRPSDIRRVREADLLYWIGPDLESFLPRVLEGRSDPSLAVQNIDGLHLRHFGEEHRHEDGHAEEHEDDESTDGEAEGEHDDLHRPGALDAHLWLDPGNARLIAARMASDLAAADPENAARYQANHKAFDQRLSAVDAKLKARLKPLSGKPFFVFHEAFDYFEEAYGLKHAGVFAVSADVQPGARKVANMRERLESAGPSCVFSEPPMQPRLAQTLSEGLPVRMALLDALGFDLKVEADGYERLLMSLGNDLANCLEQL
ncbi:zinc ABC transporter substrate-binding protein ZnuA [Pseudomonas sp. D(2018)]|uniref:zinc ABC transporter substrate-binding protein ZnuA n=1 Tax=Pseudomonadaceae TaxID=135621 RepID=UPI0010F9E88B